MYFTPENAARIDYFRNQIEEWYINKLLTESEYMFLLACLIESVSKVSNTAGVYGAFLKKWDGRALKPIEFIKPSYNERSPEDIAIFKEKTITAEYLLSYILPLFAFDFTQWSQVVLFLIFYLTLGFLCIRHNYFSVNIVLEIARFRFYTCTVENEDGQRLEQRIISHRRLNGCIGDFLYLKSLNNEYKLDIQQ